MPDPDDLPATEGGTAEDPPSVARTYAGYQVVSRLGLGGMGEVLLGHHKEIGRDVAIKRMRADEPSTEQVARFLREAKIQARLEHPAIVPVHELGHDTRGLPFFTMKRLAGVTLTHALAHPNVWSRQRLLRAFVDVCRAIDFAHEHKVVHRDLKPANVVLGDFGEVYVLDWGVARAFGDDDHDSLGGDVVEGDMTQEGAMLGTPGYMSPEQVASPSEVDSATDVYALGAILFEILAGERLHPGGKPGLVKAYSGEVEAPGTRRSDRNVPPEFDGLCLAMLARDSKDRPTVRAVAEHVERFLDGDRDVARRKALAEEQLAAARAAAKDPLRRVEAMRAANRALGLDPESHAAAELLGALALQPPVDSPPELEEELAANAALAQRRHSRLAVGALGAIGLFLAVAALSGARDWPLFGVIVAVTALLSGLGWRVSRTGVSRSGMLAAVFINALLAALMTRVFGPFVLVPGLIGAMLVSLTSYPQLIDRGRLVTAILLAGWLVPLALEQLGVIAPTWRIEDGEIVSLSSVLWLGASTRLLVIFAHVVLIGATGLFAHALATSRHAAQRALQIQAWQLRQLLP